MVSMREVELIEDDEPHTTGTAAVPAAPLRAGRARLSRRWLLVPVAGLAVLVALQQGLASVERHREHRFDGLPGFVTPVHPPLRALWESDPNLQMDPRPVGRAVLAVESVDVLAVRLVDVTTGKTLWRTLLTNAGTIARCSPENHTSGATPTRVVCVVSDYPEGGGSVPGEVTVLDGATGDRVATWQVSGATSFDAADGLVVFASDEGKGRGEAHAHHLLDGTPAWTTPIGGSRDDSNPFGAVFIAAGEVVVVDSTASLRRLNLLDGTELAPAQSLMSLQPELAGRAAHVTTVSAGGRATTTVIAGPGRDVDVAGTDRSLVADDGSLPGVAFTQDENLAAYDARTGKLRWQAPYPTLEVLVRDHVVYASFVTGVVALDGRTGRLLWRTDVGREVSQLLTDGVHVLVHVSGGDGESEGDSPRPATGKVVALGPGDGKVEWSSALPHGDDGYLVCTDGVLLSLGERLARIG
ncbi:outer membrane protein assembly factor BamB family protein [Cellulomonas alba]|uniref:PQQ-binding-like beta-propeller repeat protein n=1 Tax=Cellulomonas alba TaxID=3053467 RepID=A0ABT7SET8_9CELL|nr:PQQ-binding-like beta-propeller repeat protein [Cellulomonas alba]MDM7854554.1 PQQ-binding-like beta-propeller repeat protein [Cellulomonas alba]